MGENPHRSLSRFDAARFALSEARRVDEVKEIRDKAAAMQEYARQAKDTQLLQDATEIRLRAERRAGELLADAPDAPVGRKKIGSGSQPISDVPTLSDLGVTKTQSSKWQKLAALPEDKFEIRVEHAKARVEGMTTSAPAYCSPTAYSDAYVTHAGFVGCAIPPGAPVECSSPSACRSCAAVSSGLK
jgi:hypothetical protein